MNPKTFLDHWCVERNLMPVYEIRTSGPLCLQQYICEIRVDKISYVGTGNSTASKRAQANAAEDFISYLVRNGTLSSSDVSHLGISMGEDAKDNKNVIDPQSRPVFQKGVDPNEMGEANQALAEDNQFDQNKEPLSCDDKLKLAQHVEETEENDVTAAIHGNWRIENAKARLVRFLQSPKFKKYYVYKNIGLQYKRKCSAEISIYIKELDRNLIGMGSGSDKRIASQCCALSIVRQLFHLGIIESFGDPVKKPDLMKGWKVVDKMVPYEVCISPELENEIFDTLKEVDIKTVEIDNLSSNSEPQILLSPPNKKPLKEECSEAAGIVLWSPPQPNWNTWTGCNIDKGPLATATLHDISNEILKLHKHLMKNSTLLEESLRAREKLPVFKMRHKIMKAINDNPVIIIKGNTGCGKTTQVAQFILDDYIDSRRGAWCNVCVTQPHGISAVSAASRVADERCEDLGQSVGYSVQFESVLPRPYASVLFCTVGVLLRRMEDGLRGISHIILDEIHERDIGSDFMLTLLRDMINMNPDLRVILMSATIDTSLFSQYFGDCPVLEVPSQMYPVQQYFLENCEELCNFTSTPDKCERKSDDQNEDEDDNQVTDEEAEEHLNRPPSGSNYRDERRKFIKMLTDKKTHKLIGAMLNHIRSLNLPGAVLVFLPGWNAICSMHEYLLQHPGFDESDYEILPLHSQISREDLKKVFITPPPHLTKLILATNIAETSITINDVVFVIDSATSQIKFVTSKNMTRYATMWASRTNLIQRKGCAGRVKPGYCFTLCSKAVFNQLVEHQTPEIFRTPLHELALSIKLLRLGAVDQFLSKAPEPPPLNAVIEAEAVLRDLRCLDANNLLTPLGQFLAKLPIEPRLGKIMVMGTMFKEGDALTCIAAHRSTLSEIFKLELNKRQFKYHLQNFIGDRFSYCVAMLIAYQMWDQKKKKSEIQEIRYCKSKGLHLTPMRRTCEAKYQLGRILIDAGFPEECFSEQYWKAQGPDPKLDLVIALMCIGLYPNVCWQQTKRKTLTTEGKGVLIANPKGSIIKRFFPTPFIVFGEKDRTRKSVSCEQINMVAPLHLLLFGCQKVEWINGVVRLDNWINFKMNPKHAAAILALRPAIEKLIDYAVQNPKNCLNLDCAQKKVLDVVKKICLMDSGDYQIRKKKYTSLQSTKRPRMKNQRGFKNKRARGFGIRDGGNYSGDRESYSSGSEENFSGGRGGSYGGDRGGSYGGGRRASYRGGRGGSYDGGRRASYRGGRGGSYGGGRGGSYDGGRGGSYGGGRGGSYDGGRGGSYGGGRGGSYDGGRGGSYGGDRGGSYGGDRGGSYGGGSGGSYDGGRGGGFNGGGERSYRGARGFNNSGYRGRFGGHSGNSHQSSSGSGGGSYEGDSERNYGDGTGRSGDGGDEGNYKGGSQGSYVYDKGGSYDVDMERYYSSSRAGDYDSNSRRSYGGGRERGYDGVKGSSYDGGRIRDHDSGSGERYGSIRGGSYDDIKGGSYSGGYKRGF